MNKEVISEYYLERYDLGELPDEEAEEIGLLASTDPELQAALDEIKSSNREILALYPPLAVKASLTTQLSALSDMSPEKALKILSEITLEMPTEGTSIKSAETTTKISTKVWKKSFPLRPILAISSVAAVLLAIFLALPLFKQKPGVIHPDTEQDITLIKGTPRVDLSVTQLLVYRKTEDKVEILSDGDKARAGDLLQLAYVSAEESYGMIFSIDGRGLITLHFPVSKDKSTQLELNKQSSLPNAIELDDAPGFERFFFLTSGSPIDVNAVLIKLKDTARDAKQIKRTNLDLPASLKQYSILIRKGAGS